MPNNNPSFNLSQKEWISRPKRALVLGGGGARGAYEIGIWQALREMNWQFDIVTGTSVGALNGIMIVQNDFDLAVQLWSKLETGMIFDIEIDETADLRTKFVSAVKKFAHDFVKQGGTDCTALKELMEELVNEERVRNSEIDYGLVTVETNPPRPIELIKADIPDGQLIDYAIASASLFPAIKAKVIDNARFVDGGYYDNLPIDLAIRNGAKEIIAVDINGAGLLHRISTDDANIRILKSRWDLGPILVFDRETSRRNLRLGYLEGLKLFGAYDGIYYSFIKGSTSHVSRLKREKYYQICDLCGVSLTAPYTGLIEKRTVSVLKSTLANRGAPNMRYESVFLSCMELAGQIFSVDPIFLYTADSFREQIEQKILPYSPQLSELFPRDKTGKRRIDSLKDSLSLRSREIRTLLLARAITENLMLRKPISLAPLARLMPSEFLAAIYLAMVINTDLYANEPALKPINP